ncbi:hypothetical protein BCV69DRAFT_299988 [Microstroma glucosiphilum]|uniref:Uncharacterized protein n=1 Tax=Pseudomicrostroma glucosiphilum TaxID=1684307 RepID=A0A316U2Y1_9BASI|nr:hypothetical protein BCV69DRAFT_299988 [Pseudomicrostroma glucosiphilum]PWN19679.1 hypothetical protein BCV69DRAFT_299988 [Pseudomicrostroma glucosiphilum]
MDEGLCRIELYCSVGCWWHLAHNTVFEVAELKAAVEELAAVWRTAGPGLSPSQSQQSEYKRPEFKFCRINHIEDKRRGQAQESSSTSLQARRPDEAPSPPKKRRKLVVTLSTPIRYEGRVKAQDATAQGASGSSSSSLLTPLVPEGWGFKATAEE